MLSHIPQLDRSILAAAEQLIRVVGKANRHNWFLMRLKAMNDLRLIENSDHGIFKGADQQVAVGGDPKWVRGYLLVEICPSAWNWRVAAVF